MLFERPNVKRVISIRNFGLISITAVVSAYVTFCACMMFGVVGNYDSSKQITYLDLINGFAQIATASAFILALIQYRKSRVQQRQLSIANEAKSQLEKIVKVIDGIKVGDDTCLKNINKSITLLSNLATNFNELFKAMEEDVQKAIVRMQWQDMYFNYLRHALLELDIIEILKKETSLSSNVLDDAVAEAKVASEKDSIIPVFKNYIFVDNLLNHLKIKPEFSLKGKIESLDTFTYHYFNSHNLNELLYGLLSQVDIKAQAPILAVAKPNEWAQRKQE